MLPDVSKILSQIGLKAPEIEAYFVLLENKHGLFVSEIARKTAIKRSTVNLILDRLCEKKFVTYHLDGNRKLFSAEPPESLLFNLEETLTDLRGLIPLLHIASGGDKKTKVRFFEGKEGSEKIHADQILTLKMSRDPNKELLAVAAGEDVFQLEPQHQKSFINKRVRERIPIRWIAPDDKISRKLDETSHKEFRKMKFFDREKYQFHVEIDVYADKVALISLSKESGGVIIENKALADSFRSLFNLLWNSL